MTHTAGSVRQALKSHFPHPEYGIVFELAAATGYGANRRLDAMVMSLWPSRGLYLTGVEIKVSRNDWRREKGNPAKAEELARFCHHFYIAAPDDVVPVHELPANWGLLEVDDAGKVRVAKVAATLAPIAPGYPFLAAVFRSIRREADPEMVDAALQAERQKLRDEYEARRERSVKDALAHRDNAFEADAKAWRAFCATIGEEPARWMNRDGVIAAVRAVHCAGVAGAWAHLRKLRECLTPALAGVNTALTDLEVLTPKEEADSGL